MITGALIFATGLLVGIVLRSIRWRRGLSKPPKPVCGCTHHHAMHDPETRSCHAKVEGEPARYDSFGEPTAWRQVQCSCRQYTGPEPLPEYIPREIA